MTGNSFDDRPIGTMEADTIAAVATSVGEAGIGIVRLSGPKAFSIAQSVFRPAAERPLMQELRKLRYGWIVDGEERIDEVLVAFMKAPHTYTTEDVVEINAHGGRLSVRRILALVLQRGARMAQRGEFTKRAFLNGRLDLAQAEAVLDIIDAKTERAHGQAVQQLSGRLSKEIDGLKEAMLHLLSHLEYAINFMEDAQEDLPLEPMIQEIEQLLQRMDRLLQSARRGRILREGIKTVIIGKPNVGKSSLLNAILQENRAIVTDIPGTTRDAIEEQYHLDGILLNLIDTAGIHETDDVVEALGVDRSRQLMEQADLILCMVDSSAPVEEEDIRLLELAAAKTALFLKNKTDLPSNAQTAAFCDAFQKEHDGVFWIDIAAQSGTGLETLQEKIKNCFFENEFSLNDEVSLTNLRQQELMSAAQEEMLFALKNLKSGVALDALEVDVRSAYRKVAEITGESMGEDILDQVFRSFCIGK